MLLAVSTITPPAVDCIKIRPLTLLIFFKGETDVAISPVTVSKFLECLGSIIIDIHSFDKCDFKKVINIFQNKNLYKEFWYTGNLNEI